MLDCLIFNTVIINYIYNKFIFLMIIIIFIYLCINMKNIGQRYFILISNALLINFCLR